MDGNRYHTRECVEDTMKKAFTLIELAVAVSLLGMVLAFAGVIFNVSIDTHRTAGANAEIMQKVRAITDQLNRDFQGLQKDGHLILRSQFSADRREYDKPSSWRGAVHTDRLYYFVTGDFQSWFTMPVTPTINKSNIARVYFGHDWDSLDLDSSGLPIARYNVPPSDRPVSKWRLVHDIKLLKPFAVVPPSPFVVDYNNISYSECRNNMFALENVGSLLNNSIPILSSPLPNIHSLMAQNVGAVVIEWTDGTRYENPNSESSLAWFGISASGTALLRTVGDPNSGIPANPAYSNIESITIDNTTNLPTYQAYWGPDVPRQYWPKALKFTFTIYDSKDILEREQPFTHRKDQTFTHIVYLD